MDMDTVKNWAEFGILGASLIGGKPGPLGLPLGVWIGVILVLILVLAGR